MTRHDWVIAQFAWLKSLTERGGLTLKELLALAPQNDPFATAQPARQRAGAWFAHLWQTITWHDGTHLRRYHYKVASQATRPLMLNSKPYALTDACWQELLKASTNARYLDLVDPALFVERRSPEAKVFATYRDAPVPTAILTNDRWVPTGYDYLDADQPITLEIWIEKSTMNDILEPLCYALGVTLVVGVGFASITRDIELLRDRTQRPTRIFYISDHDKAGGHMPVGVARQIEFWRSKYAPTWDVKLTPLVLTAAQIVRYQLPATEGGAVELDALEALHPGELERIVREAVAPYRDRTLQHRLRQAEREASEMLEGQWQAIAGDALAQQREAAARLDALHDTFQTRIDALIAPIEAEREAALAPLRTQFEEIRLVIRAAAEAFDPELPDRPAPEVELPDESGWLFDARRTYLAQVRAYWEHKEAR